jgi:hypothetical protein
MLQPAPTIGRRDCAAPGPLRATLTGYHHDEGRRQKLN